MDDYDARAEAGLKLALEASGTHAALARVVGVSRAAVGQWATIPHKHVRVIANEYSIPAGELHPDFIEPEPNLRAATTPEPAE